MSLRRNWRRRSRSSRRSRERTHHSCALSQSSNASASWMFQPPATAPKRPPQSFGRNTTRRRNSRPRASTFSWRKDAAYGETVILPTTVQSPLASPLSQQRRRYSRTSGRAGSSSGCLSNHGLAVVMPSDRNLLFQSRDGRGIGFESDPLQCSIFPTSWQYLFRHLLFSATPTAVSVPDPPNSPRRAFCAKRATRRDPKATGNRSLRQSQALPEPNIPRPRPRFIQPWLALELTAQC